MFDLNKFIYTSDQSSRTVLKNMHYWGLIANSTPFCVKNISKVCMNIYIFVELEYQCRNSKLIYNC